MTSPAFLQLSEISKSYPGVVALHKISLSVRAGEVVGLIGENGAGKSTLMKVLGGVTGPSSGAIIVDDVAKNALTVPEAMAAGIAFVHQELNLFDNLSAAANIFIGREPLWGGPLRLVDRQALHARTQGLLNVVGADFSPATPVSKLSLAQRQLLEIAKALSLRARLVIMDEPTSSLTLAETARLLRVIRDLKAADVAVILITHRLNEIIDAADRVVVLRDGRLVGEIAGDAITHESMTRLMIGRDLKSLYIPPARPAGQPVLKIHELRTQTFPRSPVSLDLRSGEILGMAGLIGAGRTELARAIFGIDPILAGDIRLEGIALLQGTPQEAIEAGVFLVPEDRKRSGVVLDLPIASNIVLPDLGAYSTAGLVDRAAVTAQARKQQARLRIRAIDVQVPVGSLSGGNQQKVALAKWLCLKPRVLICDEPTRGIDVGAKQEIYQLLRNLADAGVAILMISSDMEEVIGVSDRIVVMHEGAVSGWLTRDEFSEHHILELAVGRRLN